MSLTGLNTLARDLWLDGWRRYVELEAAWYEENREWLEREFFPHSFDPHKRRPKVRGAAKYTDEV